MLGLSTLLTINVNKKILQVERIEVVGSDTFKLQDGEDEAILDAMSRWSLSSTPPALNAGVRWGHCRQSHHASVPSFSVGADDGMGGDRRST